MSTSNVSQLREQTIRSLSAKLSDFSKTLAPPERALLEHMARKGAEGNTPDTRGFEVDPYIDWCEATDPGDDFFGDGSASSWVQ